MITFNSIDPDIIMQMHGNTAAFPLPDVSNKLYISKKTVISKGKPVAIGLVRLTGEGILIVDTQCNHIERAIASAAVIEALRGDVKNQGLEDCHVFVKDKGVQKFLRHLGFQDCKGGQPMVIYL